jgi:hypothetical protein
MALFVFDHFPLSIENDAGLSLLCAPPQQVRITPST